MSEYGEVGAAGFKIEGGPEAEPSPGPEAGEATAGLEAHAEAAESHVTGIENPEQLREQL